MINLDGMNESLEEEHIGTVVDRNDPLKLGRIRVRIPEIYGDIPVAHIPWANPSATFGGGSDSGMFMIPPDGAKVRVKLFRGHPWAPQWVGTHWFQGEPPKESQISPPNNFLIKTPGGHIIDLHDDRPYIRIKDKNGNFIIINTEKDNIEIYVGKDLRHEVGQDHESTVGRSQHTKTAKFLDERIGASRRMKAVANINEIAGGSKRTSTGGNLDEQIGMSRRTTANVNIDFEAGVNVNIKAGGLLSLEAAGDINIRAGGSVNIDGLGGGVKLDSQLALPSTPHSPVDPQEPA